MTDIETRRLDLYTVLQNVLGQDPATTLMSHILPSPIPDLFTKNDFEAFRSGEFAAFRTEFSEFRAEMRQAIGEANKRIDRVLLAVVAGQFVLIAAIVGTSIF